MVESFDSDYWLVVSQDTTGDQLRDVAMRRFDLHSLIVTHPNVYPELTQWIHEQSTPAVTQVADPTEYGFVEDPRHTGGKGPALATSQLGKPWLRVAAIAAAVAVVVCGVGLGAFFLLSSEGGDTGADPFKEMPQTSRVIDLLANGTAIELVPVGTERQQTLRQENLLLVGMVSDAGSQVAAIDMESDPPCAVWTLPVEGEGTGSALGCVIEGDVFSCGSGERFDISGGSPIPVGKRDSHIDDATGGFPFPQDPRMSTDSKGQQRLGLILLETRYS